MNIYWGDIHNHCGITYGYGALDNALTAAKKSVGLLCGYWTCHVAGYA